MRTRTQNGQNYLPESQINLTNNYFQNMPEGKNLQTSKNYFKLYKEIENIQNNNANIKYNTNKNSNNISNSLNQRIYSDYSKKLGDYYQRYKEDLILYGSKNYDLLEVDNLVQEMKQYKNIVLEKINKNPNKYKLKNYGLNSNDDNLILTPLAEKERYKMGNNEKELFSEAERRGVVMRRIEYSNLLDQNSNINNNENTKVFMVMKDAVAKIEKCWMFYKNTKKMRIKRGINIIKKNVQRKVLKLLDYLNNEKLKFIYMNPNPSVLSFKNGLNLKNNIYNYNNNTINEQTEENNKIFRPNACFIDKIRVDGNIIQDKKKMYDDLQKKYYKLILDYKILQEELNKFKVENSNLNHKINILMNENAEMNTLKKERTELINNFDNISNNYNELLKEYDNLNENYTNLLNNQTNIFNDMRNSIPVENTEEYIALLNDYNSLKDKHNNMSKELEDIKNKYQELNNNYLNLESENNDLLQKNKNDESNGFIIEEETITKNNEYKIKFENLNKEILTIKNDYEKQISNLNKNNNKLIEKNNDLNNNINSLQLKLKEISEDNSINNNKKINQNELLNDKMKEYENKIKVYEKKIKENENIIKDYENKINVYEDEIKEYKNKINLYENETKKYNNKISIYENESKEYKNKINLYENENKKYGNRTNEYENKIKEYENKTNEYENKIKEYRNIINEYENKIKEYENKISFNENNDNKKINIYKSKLDDLQKKNTEYEKKISILTTQIELNKEEIIKITNKNRLNNQNEIINENKNLKNELIRLNTSINNSNQNIEKYKIEINESKKKLNVYIIDNNKLKEENSKNKDKISKLNNLIGGLNTRIKQLLEENKNIRNYKYKNYNKINNLKLFLLFIDSFFNKKMIEYKYQLMIYMLQENINNFSKYILYHSDSIRSSVNLEGYEKVFSGESRKVILQENDQKKEISINNKVIIHKDLDNTLKQYITKGHDKMLFDDIFNDSNIKSNHNNMKNLYTKKNIK